MAINYDLLTIVLDLKYSKFIKKKYSIYINKDCIKQPIFNYKDKKSIILQRL